jgi:hypothetical protein
VGHGSLARNLRTKRWDVRFFEALLSMSMINSWKACNHDRKGDQEKPMSLTVFQKELGYALLNNPYDKSSIIQTKGASDGKDVELFTEAVHATTSAFNKNANRACKVCGKGGCGIFCSCGVPVCNPKKKDCHFRHQLQSWSSTTWERL